MSDQETTKRPLSFIIPKWYGYVFASFFLLYGGVQIVLGALDRKYDSVGTFFVFVLIGVAILFAAFAYRDGRAWGWYGLVGINVLVVIFSLFSLSQLYNIPFLILSIGALALLFMPATKAEVNLRR